VELWLNLNGLEEDLDRPHASSVTLKPKSDMPVIFKEIPKLRHGIT
jgi:hypothetical protein